MTLIYVTFLGLKSAENDMIMFVICGDVWQLCQAGRKILFYFIATLYNSKNGFVCPVPWNKCICVWGKCKGKIKKKTLPLKQKAELREKSTDEKGTYTYLPTLLLAHKQPEKLVKKHGWNICQRRKEELVRSVRYVGHGVVCARRKHNKIVSQPGFIHRNVRQTKGESFRYPGSSLSPKPGIMITVSWG